MILDANIAAFPHQKPKQDDRKITIATYSFTLLRNMERIENLKNKNLFFFFFHHNEVTLNIESDSHDIKSFTIMTTDFCI